jgi:hypothetical protein
MRPTFALSGTRRIKGGTVCLQDANQLALAEYQQVIQAFPPQTSYKPFADGTDPGAP